MKKRLLPLLLALCTVFALLPATVLASRTVLDDVVNYLAIKKNEIYLDNDTTHDSLCMALERLLPEGTGVTVEKGTYFNKINASTTKEGEILAHFYLYHGGDRTDYYYKFVIPIQEENAIEASKIDADLAAIASAFREYFASARVDQGNILQQKKNLQQVADNAVRYGSEAKWVNGSGFSTSIKNGFIRGTMNMSLGAQRRELKLDATIHADGTVTMNSPALPAPEPAVTPAAVKAEPTQDRLTVDGVVQNPTVYKINGANYFQIRDLAAMLNGTSKQFSVGYDSASKSVTATSQQPYTPTGAELAGAASGTQEAAVSNDTILVNGQAAQAEVYKINGANYFKLRDLGAALGFEVGWDDANKVASIRTDG